MSRNYSEKNSVEVEEQVHIANSIYVKFKKQMNGER